MIKVNKGPKPGLVPLHNGHQIFGPSVKVDFSGAEVAMPQHLLNRPQAATP